MFKWLASKLSPYLFSPIDFETSELEVPAPVIELHDYIIINAGDEEILFQRTNDGPIGTSWLILDMSDFTFGVLNVKIELCFNGDDYLVYQDRDIDSKQANLQAWDVELPPSQKIRVTVSLSSGRKTRIAYHYFYYLTGV